MQFDFSFDRLGRWTMAPLGLGPRRSSVTLTDDALQVHMGWGFRAHIPRSSIAAVARPARGTISRGVHGWRGRWLVNGAGTGLVTLTLDPAVRASMTGFPLRLRELTLSLATPDEFVQAIALP